jgi:hypothetical protein
MGVFGAVARSPWQCAMPPTASTQSGHLARQSPAYHPHHGLGTYTFQAMTRCDFYCEILPRTLPYVMQGGSFIGVATANLESSMTEFSSFYLPRSVSACLAQSQLNTRRRDAPLTERSSLSAHVAYSALTSCLGGLFVQASAKGQRVDWKEALEAATIRKRPDSSYCRGNDLPLWVLWAPRGLPAIIHISP